jgi:hypothetical protein
MQPQKDRWRGKVRPDGWSLAESEVIGHRLQVL